MMRKTRTLAALLLATLVGLVCVPNAGAQPRNAVGGAQQTVHIPAGGTELFRGLLDKEGIQPVRSNDIWINDDIIVIVIGSTAPQNWSRQPLLYARQALQHNGAVLIATDQSTRFHEFDRNPDFHEPITQVSGNVVVAAWGDCHQPERGVLHDDTPYVVPISPEERLRDGEKPDRVWSLFRGLTKLATNEPSYLDEPRQYRNEYQHPLARLPRSTKFPGGQRFRSPPLFALGGDGPAAWNGQPGYSFLAVADASVYINQMVMEPGTDNLEFLIRTIEYLQGPEKKRQRCLFFENGRIVEKFDGLRSALAKPKPKIPPEAVPNVGPLFGRNQDKLVKFLDEKADEMQSKDALHRLAVGPPGSGRERRNYGDFLEVMVVLIAIAGTLFLLSRTLRAKQPLDVPPPPNAGAGAAATGPPGVFDRRQRELVRRNNLYEPVRNLMREFFDSVGAPPNPGPRLPRLIIDARAVRKPDSLRQALHDMWRIAYGQPMHISAQRWFELEPYFNRLRRAHEDGKWRFASEERVAARA
jgi:hypothetical protein